MSRENVEIIRRAWEAWERDDLDAVLSLYHPECEFDVTRYPDWPDVPDVISGREALRSFFSEFLATWENHEARLETLVDAGDDRVLAVIRQRFRGRGSGVEVDMHWAQISTLRDGLVVRIQNYADREEARAAAGLPQS